MIFVVTAEIAEAKNDIQPSDGAFIARTLAVNVIG